MRWVGILAAAAAGIGCVGTQRRDAELPLAPVHVEAAHGAECAPCPLCGARRTREIGPASRRLLVCGECSAMVEAGRPDRLVFESAVPPPPRTVVEVHHYHRYAHDDDVLVIRPGLSEVPRGVVGRPVTRPGHPVGRPGHPVTRPGHPTGRPSHPVAAPAPPIRTMEPPVRTMEPPVRSMQPPARR